MACPVGWGCRMNRVHLSRGVRPLPHNECPVYDTKQSDEEVPEMLELWRIRSIPSFNCSQVNSGVVAPDMALSMGYMELNCVLMLN